MANGKSWVEIVLMPLAITLVGITGTYFLSRQQIESSTISGRAQIESSENLARSDQQIKVLEIFSEKITSENVRERELAVRILQSVDPALAEKLAKAIAETESEDARVRELAQDIARQEAEKGFSFAVVGSFPTLEEASVFAKSISSQFTLRHQPEIYLAENNLYAVTLGGYLRFQEAASRVEYAKTQGIAKDAYVRSSHNWSANLLK
ncbi:MAG TPA: hypothetical protein VGA99_06745 [bacterium]